MSNPNVRSVLEGISDDIDRLYEHVVQYSGVPRKDAAFIRNVSVQIERRAQELIDLCDEAIRRR